MKVGKTSKTSVTPIEKKHRGRPDSGGSAEIEQKILNLWNEGIRSNGVVADILHINKNTVSTHHQKIKDQILKQPKEDIYEYEILAKQEAVDTLDKILYDLVFYGNQLEEHLKKFNAKAEKVANESEKYQSQNYFTYNKLIEIWRLKSEVVEKKHRIKNSPTLDQIMEEEIAKMLEQKNNATGQQSTD